MARPVIPNKLASDQAIYTVLLLRMLRYCHADLWRYGIQPIHNTCFIRSDQHYLILDKRRQMIKLFNNKNNQEYDIDLRWGCFVEALLERKPLDKSIADDIVGYYRIDCRVPTRQLNNASLLRSLLVEELGDISAWKEWFRPITLPLVDQPRDKEFIIRDVSTEDDKRVAQSVRMPG